MRYCHECGAIVSPEDTFCSYCGITLEPFEDKAPSSNTADDFAQETPAESAAEVANQTDLAIEAAMKTEPNVERREAYPTSDFGFDEAPPTFRTDEPQPAALPDDFEESKPAASDIEQETMFGYPAPVEKSQELPVEQPFEPINQTPVSEPVVQFSEPVQTAPPVAKDERDDAVSEDMQATLAGQNWDFLKKEAKAAKENTAETPAVAESELPTILGGGLSKDFKLEGTEQKPSNQFVPPEKSENFELQLEDSRPSMKAATENNQPEAIVPPVVKPSVSSSSAQEVPRVPRPTEANRSQETPGSKAQKLKPLLEGTILNRRYKIVRRIGGGGMGAVYLAEDANLGGVLRAVKEMIQAYVDETQQEKAIQDFRRESTLLTQLEHSSIPTIYDYFFDEANGRFYLVMRYISGGDLSARLRSAPEGKLDEGSVTEWAMQIADVLDYLHRRDPPIVYRDLKPSNIMLDGTNGKAMLIDFGIARWVNKEEKGVTAVGTMGYAPPELFAGNAEPRSDIYSLGATMFHLLTGADPQSNPLLIFDFTKNPRPRHINPMISVEMEDILLRAIEYNSGLRFESAAIMRDALREHLDKLRAGRLTFERTIHNLAQVMPIPAQPPPSVPFAQQPQVNMVFCGFCGEKIIATDSFCAYCGAPQGATPQQQSGAMPQMQQQQPSNQMDQTMMSYGTPQFQTGAATARLVVLGTSELDAPSFRLEKDTNLVGREDRRANIFPEIDLTRYDNKAQVSRRHARIWRDGGNFMVEDLRSSNGTILISDDNKTVRLQANQPHVLQHGDKLKLGETTLRFYVN